MVEVTLHSYSNPTGRCDECQDGPEPGCCDEFFVRPAGQACPMSSACDTIIQHCVREDTGLMCDSFTYYSGDTNSLDIDNSVHSLDNPVIVRGEEPWDVSYVHWGPAWCMLCMIQPLYSSMDLWKLYRYRSTTFVAKTFVSLHAVWFISALKLVSFSDQISIHY